LSYGGRPSCTPPPPGPRALCEVGLAACFFVFWSFFVFAIGPQRQELNSLYQGVAEGVGEAKKYSLARSGRSSCAPRPGPPPSQPRGQAGLGAALWESFPFLELGGGLAPGAVRALVLALKTQIPVMFLHGAEALFKIAPFATGGAGHGGAEVFQGRLPGSEIIATWEPTNSLRAVGLWRAKRPLFSIGFV
jgi:hypothetical protein